MADIAVHVERDLCWTAIKGLVQILMSVSWDKMIVITFVKTIQWVVTDAGVTKVTSYLVTIEHAKMWTNVSFVAFPEVTQQPRSPVVITNVLIMKVALNAFVEVDFC